MTRHKRIYVLLFLFYITALAGGGYGVWQSSYHQLLAGHQLELERFAAYITNKLDKFAHIPQLLAKDPPLIHALQDAQNSAQIDITNRYLQHINEIIGAADSYLLNQQGTTIAASNWNLARSFVGRNFAFRPYFQQAIQGAASQYYALGSTSGQRGYYYAYPVIWAGETLGVIVVKMDLASIEANWQDAHNYFVASDTNGIVFMSSNPHWLFKSFTPLAAKLRTQILAERRYLNKPIDSLNFQWHNDNTLSHFITGNHQQGSFITSHRPLPSLDLTIHIFSPRQDIILSALEYLLLISLCFATVTLVVTLLLHRRQRQQQLERMQLESKQKLEFQVMERTAKLQAEVAQRTKAEQALRHTQDELIQAAKLALLGQMSAGISHELNNPLAAIRSFAENGRRFISEGQTERASSNLERISALTERMAKISQQLKSFARKSGAQDWQLAQLPPIILSAKSLLQPALKSSQTTLNLELPDAAVCVMVNPIQLEQVMINLLQNAIEAMENTHPKDLCVSVNVQNNEVFIYVDDNGPGIDLTQAEQIFAPFHTSKQNGLGLGLSISRQIIDSMHGTLSVTNSPCLQGARFIIRLPLASNIEAQE